MVKLPRSILLLKIQIIMQNAEFPISFDDTSKAFISRSDKDLKNMQLLFSSMKREILVKIGTFFLKSALYLQFPVKSVVKKKLFSHFCGGETLEECIPTLKEIGKHSVSAVLDYCVEGKASDQEHEGAVLKILKMIEFCSGQSQIAFADFKVSAVADNKILQKVQTGEQLSDGEYEHFQKIRQRFEKIVEEAAEKNVRLLVDAEETWIQGTVDILVTAMMAKYNRERVVVFNTVQMYRKDSPDRLLEAVENARKENYRYGVKLVRGAYMEKEREYAQQINVPSPIFDTKVQTDDAFDAALLFLVKNRDICETCCATHNEKSTAFLAELMEKNHIDKKDQRFWFSQLYGMSDHITYNLAYAGYNVAKYLPYGPFKDVMPYLMRRAQENKSVAGQTSRELEMVKKEMKRRGI